MGWTSGKPRNELDAKQFISNVIGIHGLRGTARMAGVNDKTVRRWRDSHNAPMDAVMRLIDAVAPLNIRSKGEAPPYGHWMRLDGDTRVLGMGVYSRAAASGYHDYIRDSIDAGED